MDWKKKLKFVVITVAFAVLIMIVLSNIFLSTRISEKDIRTYKQGLNYLNKKDYQNAYFNFNKVSKNSAIYEIALLRQAMSADELNDYETAIKKYKIFIEKYPDSVFAPKTNYSLAQNLFKIKDYNKAEKVLNNIRKDFKDSDYAKASNYYLGLIYKTRGSEKKQNQPTSIFSNDEKEFFTLNEKAKHHFIQYLKEAENGRFALDCANEVISLQIPLDKEDYFLIGKTYFKNGLYQKSQDYLLKSEISKSWGYLAETYKKQGKYKTYRDLFEKNYPLYSKNVNTDELQYFIENYAQTSNLGIKNGWQKLLNISKESNADGQDYILYKLLKYSNKSEKNIIYEKIYNEFPNGNFASDAVSNLFWDAYQNRNYQKAKKLGLVHTKDYQQTIAAPKILFWMGKLAEREGNKNEARAYYQKVLNTYPDDYYAFRSAKRLKQTPNNNWKTKSSHKLSEKPQWIEFPIKQLNPTTDNSSIINAILKLNDYKLLAELNKENKAIQSWLLYANGQYSTSATIARDYIAQKSIKPDFSDNIYKLAYPLHYQGLINNYSKQYRLDPYLIIALIREESYFNQNTSSSVGAKGLMQLMPTTASFIAQRNNIPYYGSNSLNDPKTNIHLGCAYFDYSKERLHEDDMLATASYNGGPNAVEYWKNNLQYKDFDEFIENIPYPETKDYVKKVYRSYWVYLNIY